MTHTGTSLSNSYTFKKDCFAIIILLLICCLSYWPAAFHVFSLKNDALNYFLPVRYQVSQSFYNGYFPFWSPYFNLGYPLHGDMQSGVWNPFVQLFSCFGPYTLYTLQIETLLYIFIGGMGMYFLLRHFAIHPAVNLMCATAYMLCGFNSDCGQYLNWISGSAFLPFVVLFYYRLLHTPSFFNALITGFFLWLLLVTAYPAEFIVTAYLLAAILIWKIWNAPSNTRTAFALSLVKYHLALAVFFVVLALPAIFSFMQYLPLTERGTGANYEDAMSNPLHPLLAIAYVAPLSVFDANWFQITDPLERNSYFGIFTFLFFLAAFFSKSRHPWASFSRFAFVVFFIFSLGEWGLLRIVAYYTLPFMNSFRHPAMTKIFCIFFGVMLAAFYMNKLFTDGVAGKKLWRIYITISALVICLGIWAAMNIDNLYNALQQLVTKMGDSNSTAVFLRTLKTSQTFYDLLLIDVLIQLPFLLLFYLFVFKKFKPKAIVRISLLNCMAHALIFSFFTMVKTDRAQNIQALIDANSKKNYPAPSLKNSLQLNSENGMSLFKEIGTLNMYNKKIGRVDYRISPSNLLTQNDFWFNYPLRSTVMQYPLIYQPDSACNIQDTNAMDSTSTKKIVFLRDSSLINTINHGIKSNVDITFTRFTPNSMHLRYTAANNSFLIIAQNQYPFWQATIDNRRAAIVPVNSSFMGFVVPSGTHALHFDFKANHILIAFYVNLFVLLLFVLYLVKQKGRP